MTSVSPCYSTQDSAVPDSETIGASEEGTNGGPGAGDATNAAKKECGDKCCDHDHEATGWRAEMKKMLNVCCG